jgi:hypothetical protein
VTATGEAVAVTDTTGPTLTLLRELRRGQARRQASGIAFWAYVIVLLILFFGGSQVSAAYHALRRPPLPGPQTSQVLHAAPGGLAALALLATLVLLRDALWRGPVTLPRATVDWLLGTPVDRGRLIRPRFRMSAAATTLAGAAVGLVPAVALASFGLGTASTGGELRLAGAAMGSMALLFAAATGAAGLAERYRAAALWLRRLTPAAVALAVVLAGLAAWGAAAHTPGSLPTAPPAGVLGTADAIGLWSGPWGWAVQPMVALAGGSAPAWPLATALLGVLALASLAAGYRAAAGVPGAALRARARTLGAMSAAVLSFDARGVSQAYVRAGGPARARIRLRPPRRRELVLAWRDLLAVARTPARLAGAAGLALLAVGVMIAAVRGGHASPVAVACALGLGYLAAAWLCEGARLDAEDTRRSASLPFRFESLPWWHSVVPCLVLLGVAGAAVLALSVASGDPRYLVLLAVTVPVLVAGALVNAFRPEFPPDLFSGVDTPLGNTAAYRMVFWLAWGPVCAVVPMTALLSGALGSPAAGPLERAVVIGAGLAIVLGIYAGRRAGRLRAG